MGKKVEFRKRLRCLGGEGGYVIWCWKFNDLFVECTKILNFASKCVLLTPEAAREVPVRSRIYKIIVIWLKN